MNIMSNTEKGKNFQIQAQSVLSDILGIKFNTEVAIPIGDPPKKHNFDLVSENFKYVGEAKAFTWTKAGNNPSAKISTLREAVQHLTALPVNINTFIIMQHSTFPGKKETLAEYFARLNKNILKRIVILELSEDRKSFREIHGRLRTP